MKKWTATASLLPAVLVILMSGCATSGMEATGKPSGDPKYAKHLVIHNEPLANKIIITDMNTRITGGLLEVSVILKNLTSTDKQIQYRFSWYGDDNFEIEQGGEPWTPTTLNGKSTVQMKAVAPNASVTTYKINVREL
ncbi:MAG: YcfL family protein [Gammaproteobacteria bacterium]|nr:YcfL family protein [Gammaproteobacteria bacterium]